MTRLVKLRNKVGTYLISKIARLFLVKVVMHRCIDCKSYHVLSGFAKGTPQNGKVAILKEGTTIYSKWVCKGCGKITYTKTTSLKHNPMRKK